MSSKKGKGKKKQNTEDCPFKPGDRIQVKTGDLANELGYVRFVGKVKGKNGIFIGCELDEPRGKHDGEVKSVRYFKTAPNHGYMATADKFQYFEANAISMNWDNMVELITSYWFRTELQQTDDDNDNDTKLIEDGLKWIISYSQLARFQNVYAVGNNEYDEFGLGKGQTEKLKFTKIKVKDIERVYASDGNFFMLRGDEQNNHILCAGNNNWCQLGLGRGNARTIAKFSKINKFTNILSVSGGLNATHTFFMMKNKEIYCCGNNTMAQLGFPSFGAIKQEKPKEMKLKKTPFAKDKVVDIKCGMLHTLFLTTKGKIYGVGGNEDSQIGLGKNAEQEIDTITLIKIKGLKCKIKQIECAQNASFALTEHGVVYSWGTNTDSVLGLSAISTAKGKKGKKKKGDGQKTSRFVANKPMEIPFFVDKGIKIVDLCCAAKHVIVLDENNHCYCWGANKLGQCGIGQTKPEYVDPPQQIKLDEEVKITEWRVGSYHTFIKNNKGQWYAFGSNAFRQCIIRGDEFDETVPFPVEIDPTFLPKNCDVNKMEIVCGRETTMILF